MPGSQDGACGGKSTECYKCAVCRVSSVWLVFWCLAIIKGGLQQLQSDLGNGQVWSVLFSYIKFSFPIDLS